ncbi:MAG: GNAT family N-acetyltransferase, partial [Chloroflexota bacterium]
LTTERWGDLEELFGPRGACGGCWCMWWRLTQRQFEQQKGEDNRKALKAVVGSGEVPGLLAYLGGRPVGWCAVGPRESYPRLERSRTLKTVDDEPVWSVVCFFVTRECRQQGVTGSLLEAAIEYAARHGAKIVEGYPVEPRGSRIPDAFAYTGLASVFYQAGFTVVMRRSQTRPIVRRLVANVGKTSERSLRNK